MPKEASDTLQEVLSHPEYQPRSQRSQLSDYLRAYLRVALKKATDWLRSWTPEIEQESPLGQFLVWFSDWLTRVWDWCAPFLIILLWLGGSLLLARLIFAVCRRILRRWNPSFASSHAVAETTTGAREVESTLGELYARREWRALLQALHARLREELLVERRLPLALTDRQVLLQLARFERNDLDELFGDVARSFERIAFAVGTLKESEVEGYFQRYLRSGKRSAP